jgi:hypothetical protein
MTKEHLSPPIFGLLYGLSLGFMAIMAAGAGHGTPLIFLLASSPVYVPIQLVLVSSTVFWFAVGAAVQRSHHSVGRVLFFSLLGAHYLVALMLIASAVDLESGRWLLDLFGQPFGVLAVGCYVWGQVYLWRRLLSAQAVAVSNGV